MADDYKKKKLKPGSIWTANNLRVMRGMESGSVDLIYADPPFNSNRVYNDPFGDGQAAFDDTWTLDNQRRGEMLELEAAHPAAHQFIEAIGKIHGDRFAAYLTFMGIRLVEMWRLLNRKGHLFLHCDDSADSYLQILLTMIAGKPAYRNTIVVKRSTNGNGSKKAFPRNTDTLLYFAKPDAVFNPPRIKLSEEEIAKRYVYDDGDGKGVYRLDNLASPGTQGGYHYEYRGYSCPASGWRCPQTTMEQWEAEGLLHFPMTKDGEPAFSKRIQKKRWLSESDGKLRDSVWTDLPSVQKKESKYPTQKSLALMRVILGAASKGDQDEGETSLVFDPFFGSGSMLIAAAEMGRRWIGCDSSPVARRVIEERLADEGMIFDQVHAADEIPEREDVQQWTPAYRDSAKKILLKQDGRACRICWEEFPESGLTVDHKISRKRGGGHEIGNLQLLCTGCNSSKGQKSTTEYLLDLRAKDPDRYDRYLKAKTEWLIRNAG